MKGTKKIYFCLLVLNEFFIIFSSANTVFKITVVIDAVSETDFDDSAEIVKEAAEKIFQQKENDNFVDEIEDELEENENQKKNEKVRLIYEIVKALPEQSNVQMGAADR